MFCEANNFEFTDGSGGPRCGELAVRPVETPYGTCSWRCAKHGRGKKTYKIYRPKPTVLDQLAALDNKRKWWHYAYDDK